MKNSEVSMNFQDFLHKNGLSFLQETVVVWTAVNEMLSDVTSTGAEPSNEGEGAENSPL